MARSRKFLCGLLLAVLIIAVGLTAYADVGRRYNSFNKGYTLTGNGAADMVAIAQQQIGKTTSSLGYSGAWCAAFINDCAELANQTYAIPFVSGSTHAVSGLRTWILNRGGTTVTSPQAGDIIIYYCTSCGCYCHCGIMINASTSIEGNVGGQCKQLTYPNVLYVDANGHVAGKEINRTFLRPNYNNSGKLDVNGCLNEVTSGSLENYGTFDISINGALQGNDVNDFYQSFASNQTYSISDIKAAEGYDYIGATGSTSGSVALGKTTTVVLNFATQGSLYVRGSLDGVADDSIADYGTFDVYIDGVLKASNCTSYNKQFPNGTTYEIKNIKAVDGKNYDGLSSFTGTVRSRTISLVNLSFSSDGTATPDWQVGKAVPGNLDPDTIDVEYKYTYTQQARTSPGSDWTLVSEGPVQYENDGAQYESDNELTTSETRVLVGYYYFHWCNNTANANYYYKDYLPVKHKISMADAAANYTVEEKGTDGDGSGRKWYSLIWKSGQWAGGAATCGTNGSGVWYRGGVYQNKKAYRVNTYSREGDWTATYDPTATSTSVRWRLKEGLATDYKGLQLNFVVDGESVSSLDGVAGLDIYVNGEQKASNATTFRSFFPGEFAYEIQLNHVAVDKLYQQIEGGELNGVVTEDLRTLTLYFVTGVEAERDWKTIPASLLPYLDEHSEIEYRHTYTQTGRTSPGDDWTMIQEGAVQYENDGAQYNSDNELSTSATRVLVGYYYFHWCDNGASYNANYYKKDYLPTYHIVPLNEVSAYTVTEEGTDGDGSGRKWYSLTWKSGQWAGGKASCCTNGTQVWYRGGVYQNKKAYRINTYQKVGDWTTELDESATSVEYRIRLKQYTVSLDGNGAIFEADDLVKYSGESLTLPDEVPTLELERFTSWNTEQDGSGETYLPGGLYEADESATLYAQWEPLATLAVPGGVTTIEEEAFAGISAVIVRIPESCTEIQSRAFANCGNLKAIYIPETVTSIALDAFDGCVNLTIYSPSGSNAIRVARYNYIPYVAE